MPAPRVPPRAPSEYENVGRGPLRLAEEVGHVVRVACEVVVHRDVGNRPPVNLVLDVVPRESSQIERTYQVRRVFLGCDQAVVPVVVQVPGTCLYHVRARLGELPLQQGV